MWGLLFVNMGVVGKLFYISQRLMLVHKVSLIESDVNPGV